MIERKKSEPNMFYDDKGVSFGKQTSYRIRGKYEEGIKEYGNTLTLEIIKGKFKKDEKEEEKKFKAESICSTTFLIGETRSDLLSDIERFVLESLPEDDHLKERIPELIKSFERYLSKKQQLELDEQNSGYAG